MRSQSWPTILPLTLTSHGEEWRGQFQFYHISHKVLLQHQGSLEESMDIDRILLKLI